eukprot:TRINITY_DN6373_c0_g1_i1.p2 TRINITY_DN6373_c0_g1~~TRINITY_DN6373_c0_g1_i1.p2  ORF type:complete len:144 (+),score=0.90 TRINITY_DN6373_c0_g1_i1:462-893(+)
MLQNSYKNLTIYSFTFQTIRGTLKWGAHVGQQPPYQKTVFFSLQNYPTKYSGTWLIRTAQEKIKPSSNLSKHKHKRLSKKIRNRNSEASTTVQTDRTLNYSSSFQPSCTVLFFFFLWHLKAWLRRHNFICRYFQPRTTLPSIL